MCVCMCLWCVCVRAWARVCVCLLTLKAEEERDGMEKVKLDNKRILFNLLPAHVAQHFLLSNPRNMVSHRDSRQDQEPSAHTPNQYSLLVLKTEVIITISIANNDAWASL